MTAGRRKLDHALVLQKKRLKAIESASPQTMDVLVAAVAASFGAMAPFLEGTLLAAFEANPKRIEEVVMASCNKVLSAPIKRDEFEWLQQNVLSSAIWFRRTVRPSPDSAVIGRIIAR